MASAAGTFGSGKRASSATVQDLLLRRLEILVAMAAGGMLAHGHRHREKDSQLGV
jgi:hypothetical protein